MTLDERRTRVDRWDVAALAAVVAGLVVLHVPMGSNLTDDPHIYAQMALDPLGSLPPAPFRFRVGTTLLAAWLPFPVATNFIVLAAIGLTGTAMIVRRTATRLAGPARGLAAMVLLLGSNVVLGVLRGPYATEPLSMLAGAGALELGRQRRWFAAGLALAAGATIRETTLFLLLPLGVWCLAACTTHAARVRALALLGVPGAATYLVLHRTPLLYGFVPGEHVQSPAEILAWNVHAPGGFGRYLVAVALGSLGLLWCYVPAIARSADRYLASTVLVFVPLIVGLAIASDWARILGYGIIVAAPAVAVIAPARILRILIPAQLGIAALVFLGLPWLALALAVAFGAAVAANGGLHDAQPDDADERPESATALTAAR